MKKAHHLPSSIALASSLFLIFFLAMLTVCVQATDKGSQLAKPSDAKELTRINKNTNVGKIHLQKIKRADNRTKACAKSGGNSGANSTFAAPGGIKSCSGIQACNDFIAECIADGGEFYPDEDKDDPSTGAPTAGACVTSGC